MAKRIQGEKRQLTMITLEVILDGQVGLGEFNQLYVPKIKRACFFLGAKYPPEVLVAAMEYKEMEVIPKP